MLERLDAVQALRAIAAWLVVIAHGALWAAGDADMGLSPRGYEMLGSMGVLMFFAISGFIMAHISRDKFGMPGVPMTFLKRRLVRIVPLYWLMTAAAAIIALRAGEPVSVSHFVQSLLFIPHSTGGPFMRPVLGVGWSLNYEMFFYALFAISLTMRRGLAVLCAALVALIIIGQVRNPVWQHQEPQTVLGAWSDLLLIPFLIGVGLEFVYRRYSKLRVAKPFMCLAVMMGAILAVQAAFVTVDTYPAWWRIAVLVSCASLASFAILARRDIAVPSWLVLVGDASFSLYLVHPLLFGIAERLGGDAIKRMSPLIATAWFMMLSTMVALFVYLLIERPINKFRFKLLLRDGRASGAIGGQHP